MHIGKRRHCRGCQQTCKKSVCVLKWGCNGWKNGIALRLIFVLIICDSLHYCRCQIFFVSYLLQYIYQGGHFNLLWCKLLLYCFTQSRAVVDWSTMEWIPFSFLCQCYSSKGLLTKTRLPVGWPDRWLEKSLEAGANKGKWNESVYELVDLAHSWAMDCTII